MSHESRFHGFPKESLPFLKKIKANNTKEWFDGHKEEYQRLILEPSRDFVVEMGEHLQALVPTVNAIPKINGSLFRIYRDTRFSKNKSPIKSRIGIIFWQGRGKRMSSSAFYLQFDPKELMLAVGIRSFKKEMLDAYREYIKNDEQRRELHEILEDVKAKGYQLPEPRYKRYPRGFDKTMEHAYLSLYDGIYAFRMLLPSELFDEQFVYKAYELYEELFALHQWVYEMTLTAKEEE